MRSKLRLYVLVPVLLATATSNARRDAQAIGAADDLRRSSVVALTDCGSYASPGLDDGTFDVFTFTLESPGTVRLETTDGYNGCSVRTSISVRNTLFSDFISGAGFCSRLLVPLPAGTYEIEVRGAQYYEAIGPYVLEYFVSACSSCGNGILEAEECDDGNVFSGDGCDSNCKTELPVLAACSSSASLGFAAGDFDEFLFNLVGDSAVLLRASDPDGGCTSGATIRVYDAEGSPIHGSYGSVAESCAAGFDSLPAGDYTIRVIGSSLEGIGAYVLQSSTDECSECGNGMVEVREDCDGRALGGCSFAPCSASCVCPLAPLCGDGVLQLALGEECDDGNRVDGDGCDASCVREPLEPRTLDSCGRYYSSGLPHGWYEGFDKFSFSLASHQTVRLETTAVDGGCAYHTGTNESVLSVYDATNGLLARDADSGLGFCDRIVLALPAGVYVAEVSPAPPGNYLGEYVLEYFTGACSTCGNGIVEAEGCDDGNIENGDGCDAACTRELPSLESCGGYASSGFREGDFDEFSFALSTDDIVRLETTGGGTGCPGDTVLDVYNAEGNLHYGVDDNSGVAFCSRLVLSLPAGAYAVRVRESVYTYGVDAYVLQYFTGACSTCGNGIVEVEDCDGDALGFCSVASCSSVCTCSFMSSCGDAEVQRELGEECDDGNSFDGDGCDSNCEWEIQVLDSCGVYESLGFNQGHVNRYSFSLATDDVVHLEATDGDGGCLRATAILLYDAAGALVAADANIGSGPCSRLVEVLPAGDYAVQVTNPLAGQLAGDSFVYPAPYILKYFRGECSTCGDNSVELGEDCDDGNNVDGDGCDAECEQEAVVLGACGAYDSTGFAVAEFDEFSLTLASRGWTHLETTGANGMCPGDTIVEVYSDSGELVASDDQSGEGRCSALTLDLDAGVYRVTVRGFEGGALGPYVLVYDNDSCSVCGNGDVELGEQCDDSNLIDEDGCDATCNREPVQIAGCGQARGSALRPGETGEFRFTPAISGQVDLETTSLYGTCPGDTVLEVHVEGAFTTPIAADNDAGEEHCSRLSFSPDVGVTYRMMVRELSGGPLGAYVLRYSGPALCGACGNSALEEGEACDDGDPFFEAGDACGVLCERTPCGQPLTDPSRSGPTASDALYTLQSAVGITVCDGAVCDVDASGTVAATDALAILRAAVGVGALACNE